MYEHPYLTHLVRQADLERQTVLLERERLAREHPERLVSRRGWIHRMLRRTRAVTPAGTVREASAPGRMAADVA